MTACNITNPITMIMLSTCLMTACHNSLPQKTDTAAQQPAEVPAPNAQDAPDKPDAPSLDDIADEVLPPMINLMATIEEAYLYENQHQLDQVIQSYQHALDIARQNCLTITSEYTDALPVLQVIRQGYIERRLK